MDFSIVSILALDGVSNGAIYALLALAIVLVFTVTRVIPVAQGEFVTYGALTLAMLQSGRVPGTVYLLLVLAIAVAALNAIDALRHRHGTKLLATAFLKPLLWPVPIALVSLWAAPRNLPILLQSLLVLAIVTPLGPLLYRVAYEKLADASVLTLLIVSVGVHFAMTGLGLAFFGAEGFRSPSFWDSNFVAGSLILSGQAVVIFLVTVALMIALLLFFEHTLQGKALRATAINRFGARLMGVSTIDAGRLSFALAAFIGALAGLLIAPTTTMAYDSGFLIGLKGFVAAIFGGLASYPGAALGALFVGLLESFGSFWASSFKEVIVFTFILPVLLWRSFKRGPDEEEE